MNILPKKSWHVRNRKNIERVRRDEAEAERLACIEQDRRLGAEQEARIRELRDRVGIKQNSDQQATTIVRHFSLFEGHQEFQQSANPEYEEEERQREARQRHQSGIYNRLGRSEDLKQPWYCARNRPQDMIGKSTASKTDSSMGVHDPMMAMRRTEGRQDEQQPPKEHPKLRTKNYSSTLEGHKLSIKAIDQVRHDIDSSPEIVREIKAEKKTRKHKKSKKQKKQKHRHKSSSH